MTAKHQKLASFEDAERQTIGMSHANIGGYMLSLWGLPDALIEAVVFHHRPSDCPAVGFTPLSAVHIAEGFERCGLSADVNALISNLDSDYLARLGLSHRLEAWTGIAMDLRAKVGVT